MIVARKPTVSLYRPHISDESEQIGMTNLPANSSQSKINPLSEAVHAVTADLSLEHVLRRLAEIAAHLVNARYAALGVPDGNGGLKNFFTYGMTERQISHMDHYPLGMGLLGALITESQPIRLDDMKHDARSVGFCSGHPRMTSFLGVQIISKGKQLGSLYLSDRLDEQPFNAEDEQLITLLAGHAAVAIENATLSEQLRKLAIVKERDRIAMELHDGIIQNIYAIGLKLDLARTTMVVDSEVAAQIVDATHELNGVIEDLRRYIQNLRVGIDHTVSLDAQIQEVADRFRSVSSARLVMDVSPAFTYLTDEIIHALVQVTRETLSNIARHANASEVYVDLHETAKLLTLTISDNGTGFDTTNVSVGNGLLNTRRRAAQLGATLDLTSQPGHGTTLTLTLAL